MNVQVVDGTDAALAAIGLLDREAHDGLDRHTNLACKLFDAPVALVSIVQPDLDRQFFRSQVGLPSPWAEACETPLSHSFCQIVRASDAALVVTDARRDARVSDNLAIRDLNVVAYLGWPIHSADGSPIGALCVIDGRPRAWSEGDLELLSALAACVDDQIKLMTTVFQRNAALRQVEAHLHLANRASAAKTRFVATMSHEIRNPLNGVLGMAQVLERRLTKPALRDMAAMIRRSGEELLTVVNEGLDLAKIESGKLELVAGAFAPADALRSVAAVHQSAALAKGIDLLVGISGEPGQQRNGDSFRFRQVLHNIIGNAVKFTETGEVSIKLDLLDGQTITATVRDTGIGMAPHQLERLFQPFEQADGRVAHKFGGSGLGMSIVKKLLDLMGGTIEVSSQPGHGTVVTLVFRMAALAETADAPVAGPETSETGRRLDGLRILTADDNLMNRHLLTTVLGREGAELVSVADGTEAVEAWQPDRFDVVILDISMPGLNGLEVVRALRDRVADARCKSPRFLALTGNVLPEQVGEYMAAGFDAHISKPFRIDHLIEVILGQ